MEMHATFETNSAVRHMAALCHHFGRKVDAQCDGATGSAVFPFGRCDLVADDTSLKLHVSADDTAGLERAVQVVTSHLERFAFRERPELVWRSAAQDAPV